MKTIKDKDELDKKIKYIKLISVKNFHKLDKFVIDLINSGDYLLFQNIKNEKFYIETNFGIYSINNEGEIINKLEGSDTKMSDEDMYDFLKETVKIMFIETYLNLYTPVISMFKPYIMNLEILENFNDKN